MAGTGRIEQEPRTLVDAPLAERAVQVGAAERSHRAGMAVCGGQLQQFLPLRRLRLDALGANPIDGAEPRAGGVIAIIRRALPVAEAALRVAAGQGVVAYCGTGLRHCPTAYLS